VVARLALLCVVLLAGCRPTPKPVAYVDAKKCEGCHPAVAKSFHTTGMARSFYRPTAATAPVAEYFHPLSKTHYAMLQRDGKFYQHRANGESSEELQIDYVMGSGHKVRTYLHRTPRGTLIELPVAWYSENGGTWAMNPGYDVPAPETRRRIGYDCMFCHNAYPNIPPGHDIVGAEPAFEGELPLGIDCQRCHGPGGDHVLKPQKTNILNPAKLTGDRQMEVCMQCHLETTSRPLPNAIKRFDRGPYSYGPGEPLGDFMMFFDHAPGTGREGKFEIVNSVYRLRQSRCNVTCLTCHNPHQPASTQNYTAVCRQCHATVRLAGHPAGQNCIACHMPLRKTEDVPHAMMTDHLIQRRLHEQPPAPLEYRGEVVAYYPKNVDPLYLAVAQVSEKSNLQAGTPRLAAEIEKRKPKQPEFYIALGDAYRDQNDQAAARRAYEQAPTSLIALKRLKQIDKALELAPEDPTLWFELGTVEGLEKAIQLDPEFPEAYVNLGVALAEQGQFDRAEQALIRALQLKPYDPRVHQNLGKVHMNRGVQFAQRNNMESAQREMQAAIKYDPELVEAHDLLGGMLELRGQIAAAEREYREALRLRPTFARAHLNLGALLAGRGNRARAIEELKIAASSADADVSAQAREALQQIR